MGSLKWRERKNGGYYQRVAQEEIPGGVGKMEEAHKWSAQPEVHSEERRVLEAAANMAEVA
jgi:hypothetical protein